MGLDPYPEPTLQMKIGTKLERPAFYLYLEEKGIPISADRISEQVHVAHGGERNWLHGYIDFFDKEEKMIYEFKVVSRVNSLEAYRVQLNGYMALSKMKKGKLVYLVNNYGFKEYEFEFDEQLWKKSLEYVDYFHDCLVKETPPVNIYNSLDYEQKDFEELDSELIMTLDEIFELEENFKFLEKKRAELKEKAKTIMLSNGYPKIITKKYVAMIKEGTRTSYDYKAMLKDGLDIEKYKKQTKYSAFEFKLKAEQENGNSENN